MNYLIRMAKRTDDTPVGMIIFEELCNGIFTWAYIRSKEPSIHGLEKFMDFGFINSVPGVLFSVLRYVALQEKPHYYYFGHINWRCFNKLQLDTIIYFI